MPASYLDLGCNLVHTKPFVSSELVAQILSEVQKYDANPSRSVSRVKHSQSISRSNYHAEDPYAAGPGDCPMVRVSSDTFVQMAPAKAEKLGGLPLMKLRHSPPFFGTRGVQLSKVTSPMTSSSPRMGQKRPLAGAGFGFDVPKDLL